MLCSTARLASNALVNSTRRSLAKSTRAVAPNATFSTLSATAAIRDERLRRTLFNGLSHRDRLFGLILHSQSPWTIASVH